MDFSFTEDAEMVRQTVHEFLRRDLLPEEPKFLNTKDEAERAAIVRAATESLKEMGLYSAGVPEEFGGGGLGPVETCLIAEELAHTLIPVEWGELTPMLYECSDAQKEKYLKPVVEGTKTYAVAFQELERFSSPASMQATAVVSEDGYRLNGAKLLSRTGADFMLVFVKAAEGPTCFLVDSGAPNSAVPTANGVPVLVLSGCAVSRDQMLGRPGNALQLGRKWFPLARITRAAAILGACDRLLQVSAQYAHDWNSLGRPIHERTSIQQAITEMAGDIEALRWLVYHAAWLVSEGRKADYDSMLVKLQAQKVLTDTINRSVRIHGGTMPAIAEWLSQAASDDASDALRFAVSRETVSRLLP
ncbi:MAG: acyl-CoA dehydrogenase family protein [candidate division WOR-3 bacterium]